MSSHLGQGGIPGHIRNISETARGDSPKVVGALVGGGGGLLTLPRDGIITNRGGEVSHVFVRGGKIIDPFTRGVNQVSGWAESGSVPRVGPSVPGGCDGRYLIEGIGPFSAVNFFSLATAALAFPADFSACAVYLRQAGNPDNECVVDASAGNLNGWLMVERNADSPILASFAGGVQTNTIGLAAVPNEAVGVVCWGRAGTVGYVKANLGALATGAAGTIATSTGARIGVRQNVLEPMLASTLYELWFSILTPSDALFTSIMLEVKGRLGVTAW